MELPHRTEDGAFLGADHEGMAMLTDGEEQRVASVRDGEDTIHANTAAAIPAPQAASFRGYLHRTLPYVLVCKRNQMHWIIALVQGQDARV